VNGIEMMFKALGIDPNELRKQIEEPIAQMVTGIKTIGDRLASIDSRLTAIEHQLNIPHTDDSTIPLLRIANQ
jgi:hypothetical protein